MTQTRCAAGAVLIVALGMTRSPMPAQAQDCGSSLNGASRQVIDTDGQRIVFATRPWPVPVGRPFALEIAVCAPMGVSPDAPLGAAAPACCGWTPTCPHTATA